MNANRNLFLLAAIIGIGIFVLPSTLSMFAGQHSWYNPDPDIEGIPCAKCHVLEGSELGSGPHSTGYVETLNDSVMYGGTTDEGGDTFWGGSLSTDHRCLGCHQVGANFSAGSDWESYNTDWDTYRNQTHAAIVVECIDCHPWVPHELTYDDGTTKAAHGAFYTYLNDSGTNGTTLLKGANEACIGCHTHVGVNISWQRAEYVTFNVSVDTTNQSYAVTWNDTDTLGLNTTAKQSYDGY